MEKKLIVLDVSVGEIHIFDFSENKEDEETVLDFLDNHHNEQGGRFKASQIEWMIVPLNPKNYSIPIYFH